MKNYPNDIQALRAEIVKAVPSLSTADRNEQWWLLGTSNCHLCDEAENLMQRLQAVCTITYQSIDIADFDEALMMKFATSIPVLLTVNTRLDYPFSVLDLQGLL